jgi:glycosidase
VPLPPQKTLLALISTRSQDSDTIRFWLDRGVDGFKIDVAHHLAKDPEFRGNAPSRITASTNEAIVAR